MYFVEEENFFLFKRCQNRREVTFSLQQRPRARFDGNIQFVGYNLRQRRLAEPRRTIQQDVVQRFIAAACGVDSYLDVFLDAFLPDVFIEPPRAHADLDARIFLIRRARNNPLRLPLLHHSFCSCISHLFLNTECTESTEKNTYFLSVSVSSVNSALKIP